MIVISKHIKIALYIIIFMLVNEGNAQTFNWTRRNNPEYDKRRITYGFSIGIHTSAYQIKYNSKFVTPTYDTVSSIQPSSTGGFSLGFLVNLRFNDQLDLRLMPKASFYEHRLNYFFTDRTTKFQLVETTMVEFPLLLKYKSQRRNNTRAYVVGGFTPAFEARNKGDLESVNSKIEVQKGNLSFDVGLGFDLYFPLFKLSPEIRWSRGLVNMLASHNSAYTQAIQYINTNTVSVYFIFQ